MQGLEWLGKIAQDAIEKRRAELGSPVINWKDILDRLFCLPEDPCRKMKCQCMQ